MKFEALKKALIRLSIICLVIILAFGAAAFLAMTYNDNLTDEIEKLRSTATGNESQYTVSQKQLKESLDAVKFYQDYQTSESANPENFRREFAKALLAKLKEQSNLVTLEFTMEQFQKGKGADYIKKTVSYYSSKMTIRYTANSDLDAYDFVKRLCQSFPGSVKISSYSINRSTDLTDDRLKKLSEKDFDKGIVDGEINFEWGTILDNPEEPKKGQPKPEAPKEGAPANG